ncbi:MAG: TolC family protein [Acidobacteria bacterium]|nr:TolC family protein [Acidobacteriota bacterium]
MARRLLCLAVVCVCSTAPLFAQQASSPAAAVTLAEAIARAVAQHPALVAFQLEMDARAADAAQAARRPNPTVSVDVEDLGRNVGSAMPSQTTVSLAQRFELGGKRQLRTSLASIEQELSKWDLKRARVALEGRVAQAFVRVLAADSELALARADAETAREVAATVEARVTAGVTAPPELDRAQAAAAAARIAVSRVEEARREAVIALTSAWGAPAASNVELAGSLASVAVVPPIATLDAALEASPDIARWAAEQARRETVADTARAAKVPDLDLGAGYRRLHDVESHAWIVSATLPWPLFDRQKDRVTAANLRVEAEGLERASAMLSLREAITAAHAAAIAAQAALDELDARVIPPSERAYAAVLEGYQAGRFALLDVLDARRSLSEARRDRVRTLADLQRALITIQNILGATPVLAPSSVQGGR